MLSSNVNTGVIVPLITPQHLPDLPVLLDHVVNGGVSAVFILGTTGETLKLDQKQRIEVITKSVKHLQSQVPLLVGISAASLDDSLELMRIVHEEGAAAGVVVPHLWGGDGIEVMETLLSASLGQLMLYNNPTLTANNCLSLEVVKRFAVEKRVLGIKDSSGDLNYFHQLLEVKENCQHFKLYYGQELHLVEVLNQNIDGVVLGAANLDPQLVARVWQQKGKRIEPEWGALCAQIRQAGEGDYILGLKRLLKQRGLLIDERLFNQPQVPDFV